MNMKCGSGQRIQGHYAIVSLDGDQPRILGCVECDWEDVVQGEIGGAPAAPFGHTPEGSYRCVTAKTDGRRCSRPAEQGDYCDQHREAAHPNWVTVYRNAFTQAVKDLKDARRFSRSPVVYFVERQGRIKIGTTRDLEARLIALSRGNCLMPDGMTPGPVKFLAATPGDRHVEAAFHDRFREWRITGEWFRPGDALLQVVEDLQKAHEFRAVSRPAKAA